MSTPASGPEALRHQVESVSRPLLVRLHRLPRPLVPVATLVLVAVGVLAPLAVGLVALTMVFAFVGWIGYMSWPVVPTSGRFVRIAMLVLIVVLALTRF